VQTLQTPGRRTSRRRTEVELYSQCFFSLRQKHPGNLHLLTFSTFNFTGCGLHCRQALLPRGRKTAPACDVSNTVPDQCVTLTAKRESDARSPFDLHQITQLRQLMAGF
jgi:hypothetical protein